MDRNVEFVTQLSHLVALYAQDPVDHAAEKAALRAARAAAKHGAIDLSLIDGVFRAGHQEFETIPPEIAALQAVLTTAGVTALRVEHHAKQDEIKTVAVLLGSVFGGRLAADGVRAAVDGQQWSEVRTVFAAGVPAVDDVMAAEQTAVTTTISSATAADAAVADAADADEVAADAAAVDAAVAAPAVADEPADRAEGTAEQTPNEADAKAAVALASDDAAPAEASTAAAIPADEPTAEPAALESERGPLATELPAVISRILAPVYVQLFERLITSSEPGTLRRLLEPVLAAIEQTVREGSTTVSVRLLLAMFACEACATDDEMRRQFFVAVRRLTKPTLLRAFAMLYAEKPEDRDEVEQALARFAEDGAEAVADSVGSSPTSERRAAYAALLRRLPGTNDALLSMLDDEREIIVERAIGLMVELGHPDMERQLGEQLSHRGARVRQAAARGLGAATGSAFAADALVRAVQDASPEVRLAAAVGLQSRREARLAPSLVTRLDDEPELDVQLALIIALGRLAAPEGVQKLISMANPNERLLRRRNMPVLRLGAIEALGEARTPASMIALQKLLEDRDKEVREAAARLYTRARRLTTATAGIPVVSDS